MRIPDDQHKFLIEEEQLCLDLLKSKLITRWDKTVRWCICIREKMKGSLVIVECVVWCKGSHGFDYGEYGWLETAGFVMWLCLLLRILRQRWSCIDWVVMWLSLVAHGVAMMWTVFGQFQVTTGRIGFRRNLRGEDWRGHHFQLFCGRWIQFWAGEEILC